jgi:hypothetical protein
MHFWILLKLSLVELVHHSSSLPFWLNIRPLESKACYRATNESMIRSVVKYRSRSIHVLLSNPFLHSSSNRAYGIIENYSYSELNDAPIDIVPWSTHDSGREHDLLRWRVEIGIDCTGIHLPLEMIASFTQFKPFSGLVERAIRSWISCAT